MFSKGEKLELAIDALTSEGHGVGRIDGFVFFVPETAPGDRVLIETTVVKKRFARGKVLELLEPSDSRREPECPVFSECGGCQWQHIEYPQQLLQKKRIVLSAMMKICRLDELPEFEIVGSPNEFRYRNRIQVHYQGQDVGFFSRASHSLIPIEDCLIAEEPLIERFAEIRKENSKHLRRVEIRLDENGQATFDEPAGFAQVNRFLNKELVQYVAQEAERFQFSKITDLFCGNGNFSIPLAEKFDVEVNGADLNEDAINIGNTKIREKNLQKAQLFTSDALEFSKGIDSLEDHLVVIDPPRAGADARLLEVLREKGLSQLIYISCDPATLARDLKEFPDFKVHSLRSFDLFPQTPHVETVAVLSRI